MKFSISVALSVLPFLAPALPTLDARAAVGASVVTTSGTYVGHAAPGFPHLSEYLNIQYGQSTAGSNRFMPPVAFRSNEVFQAAEFVRLFTNFWKELLLMLL
jgi:hypothetical protein